MGKLGAAELGGCYSSKCCFCIPGCARICFPCGDDCMYVHTCPGPNFWGCRIDDDTFLGGRRRGMMVLKVVDAGKLYANPCCCTTPSEEGACLVLSRTPK